MKRLSDVIVSFFENQGFVIVSTIDTNKSIHNSCKGIVKIEHKGTVYLLDLYRARTFFNLKRNPHISITAVDEHGFKGYCLKGQARLLKQKEIDSRLIKAWEDKITNRITARLLKNLRQEKGHPRHPEALLPKPEYIIAMRVDEIIDLTPHNLK